MILVEDFTQVPEGRFVPTEGRVERCPCCGRNGIEEHPSANVPYFLHVQASEILPDGMRNEALDCCSLPQPQTN
ncbi:MAG: hypothetical protein M3542_12440 [Acidobacteriota bacterium]|nr:hypothetical protein [Acidobacteriota bacterium]MDQ5870644.1 hypothetical protein [Acidobacteriota bacterium]